MVLFVSRRERRLWLWTLTVVVAIYSTLGLAGSLADVLDNRDLTTVSFALGMLLIGVTVVTQGLRTKPSGAEIGVALGVVVSSYVKIGVGFGGWRWVQMRSEIRRLRTRMASLWVFPRVMSFW